MPDYDVNSFKMNPAAVTFGTTALGGTSGPVTITPEVEYYDSTCNQAGNQVLAKRITKISYMINAEFKEVDKILPLLVDENDEVNISEIGKNVFTDAKELRLAEIGGNKVHVFPKAIVLKDYNYPINGVEEHAIPLNFQAIPDTDGAIYYIEEISGGGGGEG